MKDVYDTFLKGERMNKRQTTILDLLSKSKKIEVSSLALMLNVSQVTIRKDLDALEKSGIIIREHGYAVLNEVMISILVWPIIMKTNKKLPEKRQKRFMMVKR